MLLFAILYVIGLFQITLFGLVGEEVVEAAREKSFKSMVKHDMAWFDEEPNNVSILTDDLGRQAQDISQVNLLSGTSKEEKSIYDSFSPICIRSFAETTFCKLTESALLQMYISAFENMKYTVFKLSM